MKLVFATNNKNKADEIRQQIDGKFELLTLKEAGINIDIPEPHDTLEANATEKSTTIYRMISESCFSEDSGLEVAALNGAPGVKSARYAGDDRSDERNIEKLLQDLTDNKDRSAQFRTVISLIIDGKETLFEGVCKGSIAQAKSGNKGFGYDPIFIPDGQDRTFAEMDMEEKTGISHRGQATRKLVAFLNKLHIK
jgi:XTP/dITP diphosphohydrolase